MATDATGTPTSPDSIPKYNTAVDAPSGKGFNAAMDAVQVGLSARASKPAGIATGEVPVWNGATWVRSTTTNIGPTSLGSGTPDATKFLRGDGAWIAPSGVATGVIEMYGGVAAPSGYVLCDGTSYLRSGGGVDALFAAIGTNYGFADGTHFNVPDIRGRIPVGLGTNASVNTLNLNDGQVVGNRRPQHRTSDSKAVASSTTGITNVRLDAGGGGATSVIVPQGARLDGGNLLTDPGHVHTLTGTVGSGVANDALDTPSFIVVNYIIKT